MEAEIVQRFLENVVEPVHTELGPHTKMLGAVKYFSTVHWVKHCATPDFFVQGVWFQVQGTTLSSH